MTRRPNALILYATGTNRDTEAFQAMEAAGAAPQVIHINQLRAGEKRWRDYEILVLPGGFSYADALGAGRLLALDLQVYFADQVRAFVDSGKAVIGICNGFQALVKAGLLPETRQSQAATLSFNASGHFECRWVTLAPRSKTCIWTLDLERNHPSGLITCPVAHGEGRFIVKEQQLLERLLTNDQVALTYVYPDGSAVLGAYPYNPNGSVADIAGICNPTGNVLGLMPHPENHIYPHQHPRWARGESGRLGLVLFQNGVKYARER
jgi:phosphoribosylformylglycinamidine synthase subunit PurQ / glutaminase